jgi:hypothetical protein
MVEYIMKKEICGTLHAKCGTRDFSADPRKAGRVVTLDKSKIHEFITSVLGGGEWSASRPDRLPLRRRQVGDWMDHRVVLDKVAKEKRQPCRKSNLGHSTRA